MHHNFFSHFPHGAENRSHKAFRIGKWVVLGLVLAIVFALLFGFVVAWLWNALMPKIFGLGEIGYWQAVGLVILAKIFFGGGNHHGPRQHFTKRHHRKADCFDWDNREYAPIPDIPEEQYEIYKQYWEERGKSAFEAYVKEQLDQKPSEEA